MIIAVTNQKGGVGKTTLSVNLSSALAHLGYRVLLVDMDPQGNSTDGLGINTDNLPYSIYDVLINNVSISEATVAHRQNNLFVIPADMSLFGAEAELSTEINRPFFLRRALKTEIYKFDYIFIDCPPNLGVLTINAILASTDIITPIEPNTFALKGMNVLVSTLLKIQDELDHYPNLLGVAINMYNPSNVLHNSILDNIKTFFPPGKIFDTKIHRNSIISEAEIHGRTIIQYDEKCNTANMFLNLANEIILQNNDRQERRKEKAAR